MLQYRFFYSNKKQAIVTGGHVMFIYFKPTKSGLTLINSEAVPYVLKTG
jgi:hypothetical protein